MANKYLRLDTTTGLPTETEGLVTSSGVGDAGKIPALDASGKLDTTVMPSGVGAQTKTLVASENLADGDWVNVWDDSGTPKMRKADASAAGKAADGYVLAAVTSGASGTCYLSGTNSHVTGLTGGSRYFLSPSTPGVATATVPTGAGQVVQILGRAVSATELPFQPGVPMVRA